MKQIVLLCCCLFAGLAQAQWFEERQDDLGPLVPGAPVERVLLDSRSAGATALPPDASAVAKRQAESEVLVAISRKIRLHMPDRFLAYPHHLEVTIEAALFPSGRALFPRVARSSGNRELDQAVLQALRRAEPLPVPPSMVEADAGQLIRLVFRPHPRS